MTNYTDVNAMHISRDSERPPSGGLDAEQVRAALNERAEDVFRLVWGEPERQSAAEWRVKGQTSRSMVMRGAKRGLWRDHKAGTGGSLLDLVAVEMLGLETARQDFPRVLDEAARFCGLSPDATIDATILEARREAQRARQAAEEADDAARRRRLVAETRARCEPVAGSPAETYLRSRGISVMPPGWSYCPALTDLKVKNASHPALVAWGQDDDGNVTGGQRILIDATGAPAEVEVRKPGLGKIAGSPARLGVGSEGPIVIAEGPETAAAIWQTTGLETWAVFGVSGFGSVTLPQGRDVILCPDADAPGSPAAEAFEKAARAMAARGHDVAIAHVPEREGSKRDLNDTLVRQGAEAVQRAIDTAQPMAAQPDEPVIAVPAMEPGRAREVLRSEIEAGLRRDGVTLVEATLGLGKTHTMIEALGRLLDTDPNGAVVVAVPMHRLGRQIVEDLRQALPGRRVQQLYGAEAQDPDDPSQTVCRQLDAYREQAALLLDTADVCTPCPFAGECKHLASVGARADVYVVSHERLKSAGTPLHSDQRLLATVVDESPLSALINVSSRPVPLAKLMAAPTAMANDPTRGSQADLEAFRAKLARTIEAHGSGYLRRDALEEWTAAEASAARGLEWRRKIDDGEDPDVAHNKTVTTASRVFVEILRSLEDDVAQNGRVRIQQGEYGLEIVLSGLRPISAAYRTAPVLMLDATAEPQVAARLAGQDLAHHAQVGAREQVKVRQATDMTGAKSFFFASGEPTGNVARVRSWIRMQALESGRTAVIGNKDTIANLDLPDQVQTGHFNALRGLNEMEGADHLVVIGRTQPPQAGIERHVAAIWGEPVTGDLNRNGTVKRTETGPNGQARIVERPGTTHDDPRGQMMLSLIRDAEVIQAIGRLRGVNREHPAEVTLISDACVLHPVEPVQLRPAIRAAGIAWPMLVRGVAFLSPAQAARAYPDLYASKQAAAKVFGAKSDWATFPIEAPYGKGCPVVEIKVPRARETTMALIAPWVTDAVAEVQKHLPGAEVVSRAADDGHAPPAPARLPDRPPSEAPAREHEAAVVRMTDRQTSEARRKLRMQEAESVPLRLWDRLRPHGVRFGGNWHQVALALAFGEPVERLHARLGMDPDKAEAIMQGLFVVGLIDATGDVEALMAPRAVVWADTLEHTLVEQHLAHRRQRAMAQA